MAVHVVVYPPVGCPYFACWVEKSCEEVVEYKARPNGHADPVDCFDDSIDDMRTGFEKVRPQKIEEMDHSIFAA